MKKDDDGKPKVGSQFNHLGVRPPGGRSKPDVDLDEAGRVVLNRMGLSAGADWRTLPACCIPLELADEFIGATGKNMAVYVHGNGAFAEGPVTAQLQLWFKPGTTRDGVVCPVASVPLQQFQDDLAATRADWIVDPETVS